MTAAFIYGNQQHYLDHLAPLASLLKIPLVVTDTHIETLAKTYYPDLEVHYFSPVEMAEKIVANCNAVISTLPKPLFDSLFFIPMSLHQKRITNVWCPHGNSDKGHASPFMEGLSKETYACVYGNKMLSFLKEKGAYNQLEKHFILGNYRYRYYQKHQPFYASCLPFKKTKKTLLYAPTWDDDENSSSFEMAYQTLTASIPSDWTLIIKPHPHLQCPLESTSRIIVLKDYPPIYPLLAQVDAYLGDMSSIGYDFLTFRRPLLFYNPQKRDPQKDPGLYLTQCGKRIREEENPFKILEAEDFSPFVKIQDRVYHETFAKEGNFHEILKL